MGRRMKGREGFKISALRAGRLGQGYLGAGSQLLEAIGHDRLAALQALLYGGLIPVRGLQFDGAELDGGIGLHGVDEGPLGAPLDGDRRDDHHIAQGVHQ